MYLVSRAIERSADSQGVSVACHRVVAADDSDALRWVGSDASEVAAAPDE